MVVVAAAVILEAHSVVSYRHRSRNVVRVDHEYSVWISMLILDCLDLVN